eukprot:5971304-Prymnesium_polylepis.2
MSAGSSACRSRRAPTHTEVAVALERTRSGCRPFAADAAPPAGWELSREFASRAAAAACAL